MSTLRSTASFARGGHRRISEGGVEGRTVGEREDPTSTQRNERAGPDTVESHMLEAKGDAFGPASSSPSALECLAATLLPEYRDPLIS